HPTALASPRRPPRRAYARRPCAVGGAVGEKEERERWVGGGSLFVLMTDGAIICMRGRSRTHGRGKRPHSVRFDPKTRPSLGRGWVQSRLNTDKSPFALARWAVWYVRFTPNGCTRTEWGRALELALKPLNQSCMPFPAGPVLLGGETTLVRGGT
uniref:Uncharacterized protein n=1 Tax=Aegilops tauschii subsp. strangulata TaxID=200361 RepID=A0A453NRF7_AEGTS